MFLRGGYVMEPNVTAIERAFQLARLGIFLQVAEIKERLRGGLLHRVNYGAYSSHPAHMHHANGAKNSMEARSFLC